MDIRFAAHNIHHDNPDEFEYYDPQLRNLAKHKYVFKSNIIGKLPLDIPGIYSLGGGRQIGKTTLLKQWISTLLKEKITPKSIVFITGEIIDNHHSLISIVQRILEPLAAHRRKYLIIDEVTYIKEWDKALKYLSDAGFLDDVIVLITGSDLTMMQESRMTFPGRRGQASQTDFHLYPLSFYEFISLKVTDAIVDNERLFDEFGNYLKHGGYLTAINDLSEYGLIKEATLATYSDWIRGDVLKRGKSEHYLKELLGAILKTYGSQVTWNSLSHHVSIDHPKTIQDYSEILASMDALFVQNALIEDKLTAAPKKAKKLHFTDPFIYHAIDYWLNHQRQPLLEQGIESCLVESCVSNHCRRWYPTFYIKEKSEVDVAYIKDNKFWPIEVKWTNQMHAPDLKGIKKYKNGLILSKKNTGASDNIEIMPVPRFLYEFSKRESNNL